MANPQRENGFTGIAHEIIEALIKVKLNATQLQIILVVLRFTYGFNRKNTNHANSFFANALGIDRSNLIRDMNELQRMNIITVVKKGTGKNPSIISFNKDYDTWNVKWKVEPSSTRVIPDTDVNNDTAQSVNESIDGGIPDKDTRVENDTQERNTRKKDKKEKIRESNDVHSSPSDSSLLDSDKSNPADKT